MSSVLFLAFGIFFISEMQFPIFKASTLLENLRDAAAPLRQFYLDHPENATATFIFGPSQTADIEMRLTLGAHGPEVAHAIVIK